jgi:hypothetical protein
MNNDKELYSKIENLIIIWNNDGTKTAGSLTRDIMKLIKKNGKSILVKREALKMKMKKNLFIFVAKK